MANLGALRVFLTADTTKYNRGMTKAQLTARAFATGIQKTATTMLGFTAAVAGGLAAVNRLARMGDEIGKGAKKIGVTAEEYQKLGFAARRSGADIGNVNTAFKRMASTIFDASNGLKESERALTSLGLSVDDLQGKRPEQQFAMIAKQLAAVTDESTKAAIAQDVFGKSGTELIPMLNTYKELAKEAAQIGLITDENIKAAEKWADAMENAALSIKSDLANSGILEYLTGAIEGYTQLDELGRGELPIARGAATAEEMRQHRADRASRRAAEAASLRAAEEKKYAGIIAEANKATKARFDMRNQIAKMEEDALKGLNIFFDLAAGRVKGSGVEEFVDTEAMDEAKTSVADRRRTENRLASALQAGSREAFTLRVRGRDAQKMKVDKNNLKANEQTAGALGVIAQRGVKLDGVAVINSIG